MEPILATPLHIILHYYYYYYYYYYYISNNSYMGTVVAQCLRCCATNWKVASSIPAGVIVISIDIKFFQSHYGLGVDSTSNKNEYLEHFLGVKAAGA